MPDDKYRPDKPSNRGDMARKSGNPNIGRIMDKVSREQPMIKDKDTSRQTPGGRWPKKEK